MNALSDFVDLLLDEKLDVEAIRRHFFFESVQRTLIVQLSDRELARRLRDNVLYWMLVFRWSFLEIFEASREDRCDPVKEQALEKAKNIALGKVSAFESKLVGGKFNEVFLPLRQAVAKRFESSGDAQRAIRKIEESRSAKRSRQNNPNRRSARNVPNLPKQ